MNNKTSQKGEKFRNGRRTVILGSELAPRFNESIAKKMKILSETLGYDVCTVNNNIGKRLFYSYGQYQILNGWLTYKDIPLLSFLYKALVGLFFIFKARQYDIILLSGGLSSPLLRIIDPIKCVVYVSDTPSDKGNEHDVMVDAIKKAKGFIAETPWGASYLESIGIPKEKILKIFPIVEERRSIPSPPQYPPFKLLFASSPRKTITRRDTYVDRGIAMLLEAVSILHERYDISLTMLWRTDYYDEVLRDINVRNMAGYASVIDDEVDIYSYLMSHHIVVIPYLTMKGAPDYPLSALEAIIEGRPVVSTSVSPIVELINKSGCGSVSSSLTAEGFADAIEECIRDYDKMISSCDIGNIDREREKVFVDIETFLSNI